MCTGTDFASFSAQLNRQFGAGSDTEVAATIGRKLTLVEVRARAPPLSLSLSTEQYRTAPSSTEQSANGFRNF